MHINLPKKWRLSMEIHCFVSSRHCLPNTHIHRQYMQHKAPAIHPSLWCKKNNTALGIQILNERRNFWTFLLNYNPIEMYVHCTARNIWPHKIVNNTNGVTHKFSEFHKYFHLNWWLIWSIIWSILTHTNTTMASV